MCLFPDLNLSGNHCPSLSVFAPIREALGVPKMRQIGARRRVRERAMKRLLWISLVGAEVHLTE